MIWVVFAVMTGAAVMAALWPLARRPRAEAPADRAFYEAALADVARDEERGLVGPADAQAARAEAARRLIAAPQSARAPARSRWSVRIASLVALIGAPALALGLYARLGSPDYPDQPLMARLAAPPADMDVMAALAKIEDHLKADPDDARGWDVVAPVYMKLGRSRDAARAYQNLLRLRGPSADLASALGEALVYASDGQVSPSARAAFELALQQDGAYPQARFFLGLAAEQDGDAPRAIDVWSKLLADAPPDAAWGEMVRGRIARLGGAAPAAPGPASNPSMAAAVSAMPAEQRDATIRGMVDNLATRLSQQGGGLEEWGRLVRAYSVLRQPDKARSALADARKALATQPEAMRSLDGLAQELGLGG